jgi:hypothetical protein
MRPSWLGATAFAVSGMHVQVATMPTRAIRKRVGREACIFVARVEAHFRRVMGNNLRPHIPAGNRQPPLAGSNSARQLKGSYVGLADGEVILVAAALTAKALRVRNSKIQRCALLGTRVIEVDTDLICSGGYEKWNLKVSLVLCAGNIAAKYDVWGRVLSPSPGCQDQ